MTDLWERALRVIPSGVQTWSKAAQSWPAVAPRLLKRGNGAHVWSPDGREFVDLAIGLGAVTLGYQDPDVEAAVVNQLANGPIFSLSHPIEGEVAERLMQVIPCAEMVKFFRTGSDAASAAIRVARAHTGRDVVLSSGYHGWHDWACGNLVGIPRGVSEMTLPLGLIGTDAAAVIIEPERYSVGELRGIRSECDATGTLLIFDEILTGFRVCQGGHQALSGVTPDLATFSKALGNGYAIAAVVGMRRIMTAFDRVGVSGTFNGDTIGLAAANAIITKTERTDYYKRLWDLGGKMREGFCRAAADVGIGVDPIGYPTHWIPRFGDDDADVDPIIRHKKARPGWRTLWRQEMCVRGFLIGPAYLFSSFALSDLDVERFLEADREAFAVLASVDDPVERLVGEAAGPGVQAA